MSEDKKRSGVWHQMIDADFSMDYATGFLHATDKADADLAALRKQMKTAIADAIRAPMGVLPESCVGLVSNAEFDAAEQRRIKQRDDVEALRKRVGELEALADHAYSHAGSTLQCLPKDSAIDRHWNRELHKHAARLLGRDPYPEATESAARQALEGGSDEGR